MTDATSNVPTPAEVRLPSSAWVQYAGFWRRTGANLIDAGLSIPLSVVSILSILTGNFWLYFPAQLLVTLLYVAYTTVLHAVYGATLGKMATGVLVRRTDLTPIGWTEAFMRSSVDYIFYATTFFGDILTFLAVPKDQLREASLIQSAYLLQAYQNPIFALFQRLLIFWYWSEIVVLLFNKKRRALHDFIAGTVVVVKSSLPSAWDKEGKGS